MSGPVVMFLLMVATGVVVLAWELADRACDRIGDRRG